MRRFCGLVRGATPRQIKIYEGIHVCQEWLSYKSFEAWAYANGWSKGMCLTRRDKSKDFDPGNCFWCSQAVANGFRRCVRRLPDGRSTRDIIGRDELGKDQTYHNRTARRLFEGGWDPTLAADCPKCDSFIDAERYAEQSIHGSL